MENQDPFITNICHAISYERFDAYGKYGETDQYKKLALYLWNIALSESLYTTLQALEINLRNNMHNAISSHFSNTRWYDPNNGIKLLRNEAERIDEACKRVQKETGKPHLQSQPGKVVAELPFGFWTSLLNRPYERNQFLWPKLLKIVFPNIPKAKRTRKYIHKHLNQIRKLRNRIFHYEPIWYWQNLEQRHAEALETISWLNADNLKKTLLLDRFPNIFNDREGPYYDKLIKISNV